VKALQEANQVKKRRERKSKRHIMQGGSLTVREGEDIVQSTKIDTRLRQEIVRPGGSKGKQRRCSLYNNIRHNARTCAKREESIRS